MKQTYKVNLIDTYERLIRAQTKARDRAEQKLRHLQAMLDEIKAETSYDDGTGGPLPPIVKKGPSRR